MDVTDRHAVDWQRVEQMPEFRELVARRRRFVVPATAFFLVWYCGFIILAGYAEDLMSQEVLIDGLTVGYCLALTQFLMVWGLGWLYLRKADREFDPLEQQVIDYAARGAEPEPVVVETDTASQPAMPEGRRPEPFQGRRRWWRKEVAR